MFHLKRILMLSLLMLSLTSQADTGFRLEHFDYPYKDRSLAMDFLQAVSQLLHQTAQQEVLILGPVPTIMEKKGGRYRAQLLLTSTLRKPLHQLLDWHTDAISRHKLARKCRWSIDVDPMDLI